jgi:hypothetical protein
VDADPAHLDVWEQQRRATLADFTDLLEAGHLDLDNDPLSFMPVIDQFVAGQDHSTMAEDDVLYLRTAIAAYLILAQVLIVRYQARWKVAEDQRGTNHVLVMTGRDGHEHAVSPLDVVYDDFAQPPPVVMRMLATAEKTARVVVDPEP